MKLNKNTIFEYKNVIFEYKNAIFGLLHDEIIDETRKKEKINLGMD